jgi:hypothetical protein
MHALIHAMSHITKSTHILLQRCISRLMNDAAAVANVRKGSDARCSSLLLFLGQDVQEGEEGAKHPRASA